MWQWQCVVVQMATPIGTLVYVYLHLSPLATGNICIGTVLSTKMIRHSWKVEIEIAAQITAIGGHLGSVVEVPAC